MAALTSVCRSCGKIAELRRCGFCGSSICSECMINSWCKLCSGQKTF